MNILENKRIIGVSAGFILAFGAITAYGYGRGQDFKKAKESIDKNISIMTAGNNATLRPTEKSLEAVTKATKRAEKASKDVTKALGAYRTFCVGDSKGITTVEFERRVREAIENVGKLAESKGCTMQETAKKLGMAAFESATSMNTDEVPYRRFQLRAVERVVTDIINAGAATVEKVYCAPLPQDVAELKESEEYFPLAFEVSFTAKRSMVTDGKTPAKQSPLPQVLNAVSTDKEFFLIPTGVAVDMEGDPPRSVDEYQAPPPASEGMNFGGSQPEAGAPAAPQTIATLKTGSPDDKIRVHINFQVLYFTGANK